MTGAGWIPGGDCEHVKDGLDRSPILHILRCSVCARHEKMRARARQRHAERQQRLDHKYGNDA